MTYTAETELTLLEALQSVFPDSSRRSLQNWIRWGRISVDGIPVTKANELLHKGQSFSLEKKEVTQTAWGIPILYEDRWMIVIDKPAGLLSVPADKPALNAFHLLKTKFKTTSLFPVHRLDQDTSGVLVFARSKMAEEHLNTLFEKHDLKRAYMAIVDGHLPEKQGTWESFLREKENYDVELTTPDLGKKAITHFEVIRYSKKFTYLRLELETGRKHQIRVQTANLGYPIVGDKRYGSLSNPFKRLCLHAYHLSFIHPFTQKPMAFTSLPKPSSTQPFPFPLPQAQT